MEKTKAFKNGRYDQINHQYTIYIKIMQASSKKILFVAKEHFVSKGLDILDPPQTSVKMFF